MLGVKLHKDLKTFLGKGSHLIPIFRLESRESLDKIG